MKQFFMLLSFVLLIGSANQVSAQVAAGTDVEMVINTSTTRTELINITQQLKSAGIQLNVKAATFNSADRVSTISLEVVWDAVAGIADKFETANMRETGEIWIIRNAGINCVGDCK